MNTVVLPAKEAIQAGTLIVEAMGAAVPLRTGHEMNMANLLAKMKATMIIMRMIIVAIATVMKTLITTIKMKAKVVDCIMILKVLQSMAEVDNTMAVDVDIVHPKGNQRATTAGMEAEAMQVVLAMDMVAGSATLKAMQKLLKDAGTAVAVLTLAATVADMARTVQGAPQANREWATIVIMDMVAGLATLKAMPQHVEELHPEEALHLLAAEEGVLLLLPAESLPLTNRFLLFFLYSGKIKRRLFVSFFYFFNVRTFSF
jgi:hypothetical protein